MQPEGAGGLRVDNLGGPAAGGQLFGLAGLLAGATSPPDFFVLDLEVEGGAVHITLSPNPSIQCLDVVQTLSAQQGRTLIFLNAAQARASSMVLFSAAEKGVAGVHLHGLRLLSAAAAEEKRQIFRAQARHVRTWYYDADLGQGVKVGGPDAAYMETLRRKCHTVFGMLENRFGPLKGQSILDVACSGGYHSHALAQRGARVLGLDHDQPAIHQARLVAACMGLENAEFQATDIFSYTLPDKAADIVYCSGLFYHLREPALLAQRFHRWARRGVVIQCCIVNEPRDVLVLGNSTTHDFIAPWEFAFVPSPSMLCRILAFAGFKNIEMFDASRPYPLGADDITPPPAVPAPYHLPPDSVGPVFVFATV